MNDGDRQARRQQLAKPLWDKLKQWLELERGLVADGGGAAGAIDYTLGHWSALTRYAAAPMAAIVQLSAMTLLTQSVMGRANIDVNRMSPQDKVALAEDIHARQPNLLASILVLPRYGVDMLQLEVAIHLKLVAFQAMKHCGYALPTISEDVQEACLQRLTATMRFTEGVPPDLVEQMITNFALTTRNGTCSRSCTATWASTTCCA